MKTKIWGKGVVSMLAGFFLLCGTPQIHAAEPLGKYDVQPDDITVSGLSSGAYMAVQMAVANSAIVSGVGAIGGGPYDCAQNSIAIATGDCMVGAPAVGPLVGTANRWSDQGGIDPVGYLARQKIWLFNGYNDGVVKRAVSDALYGFYKTYVDASHIFYKTNLNAAHAQVTADYGAACDQTGGDFINRCDYDAAGLMLQHFYGALHPKQNGKLSGKIQVFPQAEFFGGDLESIGMAAEGYIYVPAACAAQQRCRLHIAFHGCLQNAATVGSRYYAHAGYNQWADSNNLIVLYPQTVATPLTPFNPKGCWDWWGYTGADYAKKSGKQLSVVRAMAARIASGWSAPSALMAQFNAPAGLTAADSTDTRIALFWQPVAAATGYAVYRASCAGCAFQKTAGTPIVGPSAADADLQPRKKYFYKVRAIDPQGIESADSNVVAAATAAAAPACDPFYRDNYTHWLENRADMVAGIDYAKGSAQPMGFATPLVESFLRQTKPGYFQIGPCRFAQSGAL